MDRFEDRRDAGQKLARALTRYGGREDLVVLGLPRGGVPVAAEVAKALGAPFDVFLVRKLGLPQHPEVAMGAIAEDGVEVLDDSLIRELDVSQAAIDAVSRRERTELERRRRVYRADRGTPELEGRTVLVVDDGLATGATLEAAITAIRRLRPRRIVVAVPVGARGAIERLERLADDVVCLLVPDPFAAVGHWYHDFAPTTDAEVTSLLSHRTDGAHFDEDTPPAHEEPVAVVRREAIPLTGAADQYDALVEGIGDARIVLLGEATHGTHEFYRERAMITRRLIEEKGFCAVAVEGDWPDAERIDRYVRAAPAGGGPGEEAIDALADFQRFPGWMWRNADVLDFVGWLRDHNDAVRPSARAGFYGLDLYGLRASMRAVLAYLDTVDREAADRARSRYACFDRYGGDVHAYAYAAGSDPEASCQREAVAQLVELKRRAAELPGSATPARDARAHEARWVAQQNARLVKNAERYYRTMLRGRVESWNLRDQHMVETLDELVRFLDREDRPARVVVWAHNSHLGDARATEMGKLGELNVGQLVRESYGDAAVLVGFTTHSGTVTAASDWDAPAERKTVRPSLPGSYERLFHDAGIARFLLPIRTNPAVSRVVGDVHLERAIGVVYRPETERMSHYFKARLADQFDFVIHIDHTRAVEPLERTAAFHDEVAETYPSGL